MPYPYDNSLGKNIPKDHLISPMGNPYVDFPVMKAPKKKAPEWASKPLTQAEMVEQLFGNKPGTLKFPKVLPLATTKDYPGNHPANKWGKPDPTMIPDDKADTPKGNWAELVDAQVAKVYADFTSSPKAIWNDFPSLPPVQGNLSTAAVDPYYYKQKPYQHAPQFLGKMMDWYDPHTHSQKIGIKLKVEGLGISDVTFGLAHSIADHAAFNMNTDMLSHVLDEAFAKMKDEIMRKVIMEASKK